MIRTLLLIGAGSFIGGVARYLLSRDIHLWAGSSLPWGTLAVNVIGCLILGVLYGVFERGAIMDQDMRLALTVGLCGGFTTFSTFVHEDYRLLFDGNILYGIGYPVASLALGLLAAYLGHLIVKTI